MKYQKSIFKDIRQKFYFYIVLKKWQTSTKKDKKTINIVKTMEIFRIIQIVKTIQNSQDYPKSQDNPINQGNYKQ